MLRHKKLRMRLPHKRRRHHLRTRGNVESAAEADHAAAKEEAREAGEDRGVTVVLATTDSLRRLSI
jgi:hypothetical protein